MNSLRFEIQIMAKPSAVWLALWEPNNYRVWTNVFMEGTYYKTDNFVEGARIHFLTPEGHGMYGDITKIIPEKFVSFTNIGDIKETKELPPSQNQEGWVNANESYLLTENENGTHLLVEADSISAYEGFMNKTFPLALIEIKKLAESISE
jgi:uncharacterized protein YndB with AHSA1/START domain